MSKSRQLEFNCALSLHFQQTPIMSSTGGIDRHNRKSHHSLTNYTLRNSSQVI